MTSKKDLRTAIGRLEAERDALQVRLEASEDERDGLERVLQGLNPRRPSLPERVLNEGRSILSIVWPWP